MNNINLGCGQHPATGGWINYDNSFCVKLASMPILFYLFKTLKLLQSNQVEFVRIAQKYKLRWADIRYNIPEDSNTVDTIYVSHVLENLYRSETESLLKEAFRTLRPGGVIRICAMDIKKIIDIYNKNSDAELLMTVFFSTRDRKQTIAEKVKSMLFGDRNRKWYYDAGSLIKLLTVAGFDDAGEVEAGKTTIAEPGQLNLYEQFDESMYIEARKPNI